MISTVKIKLLQHHRLATYYASIGVVFILILHVSNCSHNALRILVNNTAEFGKPHHVTCRASHSNSSVLSSISWFKENVKLDNVKQEVGQVTLDFEQLSLRDISEYTCNAILTTGEKLNVTHNVTFDVVPRIETAISEDIKRGMTVSMRCDVSGYPLPVKESITWTHEQDNRANSLANSSHMTIFPVSSGLAFRHSSVKIVNVTDLDNGTYYCQLGNLQQPVHLKVLTPPFIKLHLIKAIGESEIFLNWTLKDGNSPLTEITLSYKDGNSGEVRKLELDLPNITQYVLRNLSRETRYTDFVINAINAIGSDEDTRHDNVTTMSKDPFFVPTIAVNGVTAESVTLGWQIPQNVSEYYHFYNVTVQTEDGKTFARFAFENPYLVTQLQPGKNYSFKVQACSSFTQKCDGISNERNEATLDGKSSAPRNINVSCPYDEKSREAIVRVSWDPPQNPAGHVIGYSVVLAGKASYLDRQGSPRLESLSSLERTVLASRFKEEFGGQPPNTNFTVTVCARTRTRQCGDVAVKTCTTPVTVPDTEELSQASWTVVTNQAKKFFFLISLPAISQRNGSICCFWVVVVRLQKRQKIHTLGSPYQIPILNYSAVHNADVGGAYVAEMLVPSTSSSVKITIGDEENYKEDKHLCHKCFSSSEPLAAGVSGSFRRQQNYPSSSSDVKKHKKRHASSGTQGYAGMHAVRDGPLDSDSNYTAFICAIVINDKQEMQSCSRYLRPLQPRASESRLEPSTFSLTTQNMEMLIIGSLIVALILVFMALMCVMRWRRKEPGDQEYGMAHSIQQLCRRLRGQHLIPNGVPPDQPPISKEQLVTAYQERHENVDIGFQKEFEDLPDRFRDRTTDASEKNVGKNRYPDIKAYDQTRVKLSIADGGCDYINANVVVGYKERKKFICAQGPMESTVVDWWRMIWEQRIHLLLMLTNVEEYSKTKCAKYWPSEGSNEYGNITVTHTGEKRYSDYLVRTLKIKLNGPDGGDSGKDEREVEQYHYLVWKDYQAPEHPVGIIRFIKRFNEVYSMEKGPILVHCSAGVGRTGTLVALDSLLQQLNEEGCVSIFNTICDLRHQRNYLVQSLKQYIFIYRALMEASLFGDTEITVADLKTHLEKLKSIPDGKTVSRIQEEFEKLSQVVEDRKPFSAGASDENRHRNRHENVIPYDRNRVILSPMPGLNKEICTYINASFIEGYDNSEQFIIAQDPLETTVAEFWRMIVEHNIRSVVMLSEVGEDKCPRYWPEKDQETSHDYIKVKYMQSQSFPYYYRREFTVTKGEDSCLVTQFQYNGWPTGESAVPESTRGIVELIDTTVKHKETLDMDKCLGPTLIHCSAGADRSCIFVALAVLVRQMMNESRVDVFSVVRKLRSQRQCLFQNLAQYEFIHRGLDIYADLHVANGNASH